MHQEVTQLNFIYPFNHNQASIVFIAYRVRAYPYHPNNTVTRQTHKKPSANGPLKNRGTIFL